MSLLYRAINTLAQFTGVNTVAAHCDIPCKIYDPYIAQYAALSVVRQMDLMAELEGQDSLSLADQAKLSRLVAEKEHQAETVKKEVRVIWGDYFKAPQFEQFPETSELVHNIMLTGSACKQGIDKDKAVELVGLINDFAASFWATKGIATYTATCPFPPSLSVVYADLKG